MKDTFKFFSVHCGPSVLQSGLPPLRSFVEVPAPSVTVCEHRAIKLIKATYIHNSAALIQDPLPSEGASGGSCTQLALGGGGVAHRSQEMCRTETHCTSTFTLAFQSPEQLVDNFLLVKSLGSSMQLIAQWSATVMGPCRGQCAKHHSSVDFKTAYLKALNEHSLHV